jgi:hypothetical protein
MSYYGIGGDPRNRFRKLPRVKRSRSSVGNIRGGGSIGLPNRNQLMGAQPPAQRIPQRQQTGGGSSITTGPEQTPPEQEGLLGGLLQAKGAYEGVKEAATGGKNIRNYVSGLGDNDSVIAMRNMFSDTYIPNSVDMAGANADVINRMGGSVGQRLSPGYNPLAQGAGGGQKALEAQALQAGAGGQNIGLTNFLSSPTAQAATQIDAAATIPGLAKNPEDFRQFLDKAPQYAQQTTLPTQTGVQALNAGGTPIVTKDGAKVVSGLKSPPTQGVDKLGVAGAGLGAGLSAYDISQNGFNFGNTTGLLGSAALLAGGPFTPWGIGLLGASAVDSIFDIF